jgi:hypothetical protein
MGIDKSSPLSAIPMIAVHKKKQDTEREWMYNKYTSETRTARFGEGTQWRVLRHLEEREHKAPLYSTITSN